MQTVDTYHPAFVDVAGHWLEKHGGAGPTYTIDDEGRCLVRAFFYGPSAWSLRDEAAGTAKDGGFYRDSFSDDGDPALVIVADLLAAISQTLGPRP